MEQDAGKSIHDQHPSKSYIDLNRSGVCLMEIVSEPDLRSPEEAGAYLKKLRAILRYLGTCDGNMEEGSMRCDANVSVRKVGETAFGTRCEIKNVNSIRYVMQAIEYEAGRQVELIEDGGKVDQETRLWDVAKGVTRPMRSKEHAHDYRYFPDPDLLPLVLDPKEIARIKAEMPELPDAKKARFVEQYKLTPYDASVLVAEKEQAAFFEEVAKGRKDPKLAANWVIVELFGALNKQGKDVTNSPVSAKNLAGLLDLMENDTISGRIAKDVFAIMVETGKDAASIVEEKGLKQVTDTGAIDAAIAKVMAENEAKVAEYRAGKVTLFGWFVGQVMKGTGGKANPAKVNEILKAKLAG
jgi:aspartyl-tRNA(Asn)/glutamyl-tRNA(Gln) amidotransferase subunit B